VHLEALDALPNSFLLASRHETIADAHFSRLGWFSDGSEIKKEKKRQDFLHMEIHLSPVPVVRRVYHMHV
jgi:hypothetical protein